MAIRKEGTILGRGIIDGLTLQDIPLLGYHIIYFGDCTFVELKSLRLIVEIQILFLENYCFCFGFAFAFS